jgi:hypothetical protein
MRIWVCSCHNGTARRMLHVIPVPCSLSVVPGCDLFPGLCTASTRFSTRDHRYLTCTFFSFFYYGWMHPVAHVTMNGCKNPSFATMFQRALLNTCITTCFGSQNMLWYTCLIKHAETLLRTKDCCTFFVLFMARCLSSMVSFPRSIIQNVCKKWSLDITSRPVTMTHFEQ